MITTSDAGLVGTELVKRVGTETGAADLATDHTETETGVESETWMVAIEVSDGKWVIVATVIAIAKTETDVVSEMSWMTLQMVSTKSRRRGSNQTITWTMWPLHLHLHLKGPHRHLQETVPAVGLLTADIAHMKGIAGTMIDPASALVIHEMNLTNRDLIEGTRILAGGMTGVALLVTMTVMVAAATGKAPPPLPPPSSMSFSARVVEHTHRCRPDDHLQLTKLL